MIIYNSHYPHLIFVFMFPHLFNTSNFLCSNEGRYTIFTTVCKSVFVCTGTVRNFVPEQQLVTSPACSLNVCVNVFVLMYIIRGFLLVIAHIHKVMSWDDDYYEDRRHHAFKSRAIGKHMIYNVCFSGAVHKLTVCMSFVMLI